MGLLVRGILWSGLYLALVLAPLGFALVVDPIAVRRPFTVELGAALGWIAFAVLASECALVARLRAASEPFGTDLLMLFHRQMGCLALALVAVHAVLPFLRGPRPGLPSPFSGTVLQRSGALALWSTLLLVGGALARKRLGLGYELWRALHALLALAVVGSALVHVLASGGYAGDAAMRGLAWLYVGAFLGLMLHYRLARPALLWRRPWELVANRPEGGDTRTLVLRPVGHRGLEFAPGQFAWLITGSSPLSAQQHPITIASSAELPADRSLEFTIKALGDWSREGVPALAAGARLWVDGPFGAFTPDREPGLGLVLIAGGIGITPMRSILLTMRDRGDRRPVVLFYAARKPERAVFGAELAALEDVLALEVVYVFEDPEPTWPGERGLVTTEVLRRRLPSGFRHRQFFACGPPPMMESVERSLTELGVPAARVHTERFDMV
jgi:predicted ferric reductase